MMVPMVVEKTSKGSQVFDIFSMCLKENVVFINGPIATEMSHVVAAQLLYLESVDPEKPIYIYINSFGGECRSGLFLYDTIQHIKNPIKTVACGAVCSMGSFLANAGSPGHRYILPNAAVMIHAVRGGSNGSVHDAMIQMEEMVKLNDKLTELYVKHNSKGKTIEDFKQAMSRDYWLSAEEAIEFGLVDSIMTSRKELPL